MGNDGQVWGHGDPGMELSENSVLKMLTNGIKREADKVAKVGKMLKSSIERKREANKLVKIDPVSDRLPEWNMNFEQIVAKNGYEFHSHSVHTADGYILNLFRITTPGYDRGDKPVVFLQHGITDSADCWIMHTEKKAPAFRLLREGYDVWLGNQRGTKHSLTPGHETLDPKRDRAYWQFSFTEMGDFDAPAQVDYVRAATGQSKIAYVGHSQGTTQMFYALSEREDFWAERLHLFVALAPVTALGYTGSQLFRYVARHTKALVKVLDFLRIYSLLDSAVTSATMKVVCRYFPDFCEFATSFLITKDPSLDDKKSFEVYMAHFPSGASVQSLLHYAQLVNSGRFELFDWGSGSANRNKYNQETPPVVNLSKISGGVPVGMFVGTADDLGDVTDGEWSRDQIEKGGDAIRLYREVPAGHATFMIGKDMGYLDEMVDLLRQYPSSHRTTGSDDPVGPEVNSSF
eukprot:CAMPEP_0194291486 /NCGR_PEP_ID=MMETSP0169-20130528/43478_1 /TAXON_ID=218684 /ORGANISM="Corethron pennatum, Strain L29A3" /LENGTH=460 /DNA_ID=CAMNT_0039039381 /DNA_START=91 /DNA_END=1473 /DNA_ORIENTATION=-